MMFKEVLKHMTEDEIIRYSAQKDSVICTLSNLTNAYKELFCSMKNVLVDLEDVNDYLILKEKKENELSKLEEELMKKYSDFVSKPCRVKVEKL